MTDKVKVTIEADGSQVGREANKVKKDLAGVASASESLSGAMRRAGGFIAGALSVGAVTSFLSKVNQAADQIDGLSQRLAASASGLQTLQIAAAQAGGSAEAMQNALAKMSVSLGDALNGSKPVNDALGRLNLSARELAGLKTDEAMRRIAGAMSEVGNSFERASIGQAIFGKGAKDLAEFFAVAPGQISEVEQALADAGATLSDIDVAKIGLMNDQLAMQGTIVQNLGIKFLANLSPAVGVATEAFAGLLSNMGGATQAGKTFGVVMTAAVKLIESGVYALAAVFETLRATVAVVLAAITNAVGNLIGLLASAAEIANLGIADELRAASNAALSLGTSFANVSASAMANARQAGAASIQAAQDFLRAQEIFDQAAAAAEARASAAAAQAGVAQGAIGASAAGSGFNPDAARGGTGLSKDTLGANPEQFDPLADPRVLQEMQVNDALQALQDQHDETMLGKLEMFNQTRLGSLLSYNDMMMAAEDYKNMSLGEMGNNLAALAMQQGGTLGKIGKAYAIAQTIWSTGTAIMKAMAEVPYPANIVAAAGIAAMGIAQLSNIKKTNLGGGGSVATAKGASGGGAAASAALPDRSPAVEQSQPDRTAVQIVVQGNLFSSTETAEWLAQQLGEMINGRDMVFINSNSRQALELAGTGG